MLKREKNTNKIERVGRKLGDLDSGPRARRRFCVDDIDTLCEIAARWKSAACCPTRCVASESVRIERRPRSTYLKLTDALCALADLKAVAGNKT